MNNKEKMNSFSLALGLFDYINPIFYSITSITVLLNMKSLMAKPVLIIYAIGMLMSLVFGFTIPTVKCLVGLGKFEFKMPVNLVFYVNSGILLSGMALSSHVLGLSFAVLAIMLICVVALLAFIVYRTGKFNTAAVLTGAVGYILIYSSLIALAIKSGKMLCVAMYGVAICLFVFLFLVGIGSDLKKPKVHWAIEISNVVCQMLVAVSTILLFR